MTVFFEHPTWWQIKIISLYWLIELEIYRKAGDELSFLLCRNRFGD